MPLNETLTEGLDTYNIGPKLRDLRLTRKMGLVELGKHTGLSAGTAGARQAPGVGGAAGRPAAHQQQYRCLRASCGNDCLAV